MVRRRKLTILAAVCVLPCLVAGTAYLAQASDDRRLSFLADDLDFHPDLMTDEGLEITITNNTIVESQPAELPPADDEELHLYMQGQGNVFYVITDQRGVARYAAVYISPFWADDGDGASRSASAGRASGQSSSVPMIFIPPALFPPVPPCFVPDILDPPVDPPAPDDGCESCHTCKALDIIDGAINKAPSGFSGNVNLDIQTAGGTTVKLDISFQSVN